MTDRQPPGAVAESFRLWPRHAHGSLLYQHLASRVADDPELVVVAAGIEHGPRPNMLFAAVHFLLLAGLETPLAGFYASLTDRPASPEGAYPAFREVVLAHAGEILEIGRTRYVQTNEVRRCSLLLPALGVVAARLGPFHLIDIGCSAGLNLAFDRYRYDYGEAGQVGRLDAGLVLECEARGEVPVPAAFPRVGERVGLDLHPVDPNDREGIGWLRALIWPEQGDRVVRFEVAVAEARRLPIRMVAGDAVVTLPEILGRMPSREAVVVMHSFTLNQFPPSSRRRLDAVIAEEASYRPLVSVGLELESLEAEWPMLRIDGTRAAIGHAHGEWIEWIGTPTPYDRQVFPFSGISS